MPHPLPPGVAQLPLADWVALSPATAAVLAQGGAVVGIPGTRFPRRPALAERLAAANRAWGNPVDGALADWLAGAEVVVTGQQPGLLGGPLLTLVKASAVAALVRRRRAAGRPAVGFLWLATADDDLPEMGWARVAVGEQLVEGREEGWRRGMALGGAAVLGTATAQLLDALAESLPGQHAQEAVALARACYRPGATLGEATARFLGSLLQGSGVVLVDAREEELARSAAPVVTALLADLAAAWDALADGEASWRGRGWPPVLAVTPARLPVFRKTGVGRERLASAEGRCPVPLLVEHEAHPERFLPNAWLRPLVQDAALDTSVALLGGAELAYHLQTAPVRQLVGMGRPRWCLRPHITVVTAAERRLAGQLGVGLAELAERRPPRRLLPGQALQRELGRAATLLEGRWARLAARAAVEVPAARGDIEATRAKVQAALAWLDRRLAAAALRHADTAVSRWHKLQTFLRPRGRPQERELSVLAPLLRLGVAWPRVLAQVVEPEDPGMSFLFWEEGGAW